jgi:hypothetical protein
MVPPIAVGPLPVWVEENPLKAQQKIVFCSSSSSHHDAFSFSGHLPKPAGQAWHFAFDFEGPKHLV